jgi:hypothetical protein
MKPVKTTPANDPKDEAARAIPGRAKDILDQSGIGNPPRDDDRVE